MSEFSYNGSEFMLDGKPFTVLSGAMHYFRIPREYWHDRLLKLRECGFNTVETYIPWNLHEKTEGCFDFSGMLDLPAYIDEAAALGLKVILRPGPYICAEWDFGGFPAWLLSYPAMRLRCNDPLYVSKVRAYFTELLGRLSDKWSGCGGPVILCQIENEYGSYGDDKDYLRAIVQIYRDCGVNCQLYTSDGTAPWMLSGGTLDDQVCVANFGSNAKGNFEALNAFRPGQPTMCGEFWCGWFDHWHEKHHTRPAAEIAQQFTEITNAHASVNFYMFHGGTNFGFMNGANHSDCYQPTITSYDYCALLSEAGDRTEAYYAVRDLIAKNYGGVPALTAKESEKAAYGDVELTKQALLLEQLPCLGRTVRRAAPAYMEELGQNTGYIHYATTVHGPTGRIALNTEGLRDRGLIYIDGEFRGIVEPGQKLNDRPEIDLGKGESAKVEILVENMGHVNYGIHFGDKKGMHAARFTQRFHFGWDITPLPMEDFSQVIWGDRRIVADKPQLLRGTLTIDDTPRDTFVRFDGFHKGFAVINGFNIGRFWNDAGPQKTLYVPAPFLKKGVNEIIVFESDGTEAHKVTFCDTPDLG